LRRANQYYCVYVGLCGLKTYKQQASFISAKAFEKSAKWLYLRPFLAEGVRGYWLKPMPGLI